MKTVTTAHARVADRGVCRKVKEHRFDGMCSVESRVENTHRKVPKLNEIPNPLSG